MGTSGFFPCLAHFLTCFIVYQPLIGSDRTFRLLSSEAMRASWDREIAVLKAISPHPRCISLLDTLELEDCWCLVMEYVPGGELFDWVAKEQSIGGLGIEEGEARRVFGEIMEGGPSNIDILSHLTTY